MRNKDLFESMIRDLYGDMMNPGESADEFMERMQSISYPIRDRKGRLVSLSTQNPMRFPQDDVHTQNQGGSFMSNASARLPGMRLGEEIEGYIDRTWSADDSLRVEFNNDKASYAAFCRAEAKGLIRVQGRRNSGRG